MDVEIFIDEVCNIITDQINKYDDMKVNKALSETLMLIIKLKTGNKKNYKNGEQISIFDYV